MGRHLTQRINFDAVAVVVREQSVAKISTFYAAQPVPPSWARSRIRHLLKAGKLLRFAPVALEGSREGPPKAAQEFIDREVTRGD